MSAKERVRLEALSRVKRSELTVASAAVLMGLSLRQARRVWKRFKDCGEKGLLHGLRGVPGNRRLPAELAARAVKLKQERYGDYGATLACEKLLEDHGIPLSPDTLTALLKARGLWVRRRRRDKHRRRRERRACFGSMVQMDGSHHDWLEGRAGKASTCVLMVMIDDATNRTYARLYPAETTEAAFDVALRWMKRQGLPRSVYVDRHSIYRDEDHPDQPTQFGRAMKELQVEMILAHSPQAKGRVERRHAVFQDRFVKELRDRKIDTMEQANALLEERFLPWLNRRYAFEPRESQDLHRTVATMLGSGEVLEEVLCVIERRVVGKDWCVRYQNRWLQIDAKHAGLCLGGKKVTIKRRGDGRLVVESKGTPLAFVQIKSKPAKAKARQTTMNNRGWKPGARHPWRVKSGVESVPRASPAPAAPARALHAARKLAG